MAEKEISTGDLAVRFQDKSKKRLAEDLRDYDLSSFLYSEDMDREVQPGEIMVAYGM